MMKSGLKNSLSVLFLLLLPFATHAQLKTVTSPDGTASGNLEDVVLQIVNGFLGLAGLVAAIILIYAGVQYILARGDESAAETAKKTILYAIVGLIVIGLAAVVVNFVIGAIQGNAGGGAGGGAGG